MSKFYAGQTVVYVKNFNGPLEGFEIGESYVVCRVDQKNRFLFFENDGYGYAWERFETFDEWAEHQKRVSVEDELMMTKLQVASLQQLKRDNEESLREALNTILWLYRRLPQGYANVPSVDRSVKKIAEALGENVDEYILERAK